MNPYLSKTAYATPKSIHDDTRAKRAPVARIHITYPYGKTTRAVQVELDRADLLAMIANAADALRLLDEVPR